MTPTDATVTEQDAALEVLESVGYCKRSDKIRSFPSKKAEALAHLVAERNREIKRLKEERDSTGQAARDAVTARDAALAKLERLAAYVTSQHAGASLPDDTVDAVIEIANERARQHGHLCESLREVGAKLSTAEGVISGLSGRGDALAMLVQQGLGSSQNAMGCVEAWRIERAAPAADAKPCGTCDGVGTRPEWAGVAVPGRIVQRPCPDCAPTCSECGDTGEIITGKRGTPNVIEADGSLTVGEPSTRVVKPCPKCEDRDGEHFDCDDCGGRYLGESYDGGAPACDAGVTLDLCSGCHEARIAASESPSAAKDGGGA